MSRMGMGRLNAIHAVAWAGCLGLVAVIGLSWVEHDLVAAAYTGGFVAACTFLGLILLAGKSVNVAAVACAAALATAGFWLGPLERLVFDRTIDVAGRVGISEEFSTAYLALPCAALAASMIVGILLHVGTTSPRVGVQSILGGVVAAGCLAAPGDPALLIAAAGLLWGLIVLLSLASWARDHAMRLSDYRNFVQLGQDGPLATLSRGSTQQPG